MFLKLVLFMYEISCFCCRHSNQGTIGSLALLLACWRGYIVSWKKKRKVFGFYMIRIDQETHTLWFPWSELWVSWINWIEWISSSKKNASFHLVETKTCFFSWTSNRKMRAWICFHWNYVLSVIVKLMSLFLSMDWMVNHVDYWQFVVRAEMSR